MIYRLRLGGWMGRAWRGRFARDVALTAGGNFSVTVAGAVGGILAARLLGPAGRGELAAAIVWAGVLGTVAQLGMPQALIYHTARDAEATPTIFTTALGLLLAQSAAVILLGQLLVSLTLARWQPAVAPAVRYYLLSIPCTLLSTYLCAIAQGLRRFHLASLVRTAMAATYILALVVAFAWRWQGAGDVLALFLALQAATALILLLIFLRLYGSGRLDGVRLRELIGYGLKAAGGDVAWIANARLDQFVMSAFVSPSALGQYAVAVSYATTLFPLSGALAMVLFPHVANGRRGQAGGRIKRALAWNLVVSAAGAIVLALVSPLLLPWLFGVEFQAAVWPAVLLLGGTVILGSNYVLSDGLRGLGRPALPSAAQLMGVGVTVVGLLLLLPVLGIMGAAVASVLSYGVALLYLAWGLRRVLDTDGQARSGDRLEPIQAIDITKIQ
ncbi:MAG: oligosaccharide flippase family protein [Chloroflexota bacterium]